MTQQWPTLLALPCGGIAQAIAHNSAKLIKAREQVFLYSKTRLGLSPRVVLWIAPVAYAPFAMPAGAACALRWPLPRLLKVPGPSVGTIRLLKTLLGFG